MVEFPKENAEENVNSIMHIHAVSINKQNNSWQKSAASVDLAIVHLKTLYGRFFHLPMTNYDYDPGPGSSQGALVKSSGSAWMH